MCWRGKLKTAKTAKRTPGGLRILPGFCRFWAGPIPRRHGGIEGELLEGWPGMFAATLKGQTQPAGQMTYQESWAFVQAYRPFSTHLCPDGTGEDADISCGDPWYREIPKDEPGLSLVVVRTETGRRVLRGAIEAGYVTLKPAEPWKLLASQKNLMAKRGAIGGRIAMLRMLGLPVTRLRGFSLFKNWRRLTFGEKLRSTLGTVRRIITRRYYRPLQLNAPESRPKPLPADTRSLTEVS